MARRTTLRQVERVLQDHAVALGLTIAEVRSLFPAGAVRRSAILASLQALEDRRRVAWCGERVRWVGPLAAGARPLGLDPADGQAASALTTEERRAQLAESSGAFGPPDEGPSNPCGAVLVACSRVLKRRRVGHALVGRLALACHGVLGSVEAVDLLVEHEAGGFQAAWVEAVGERGFETAGENTLRRDGVEVRLHPMLEPMDRGAYARCKGHRSGQPRFRGVPIAAPEDLALMALRAYVLTHDPLHLGDARRLLVAQRLTLDVAYLERGLRRHGFTALWRGHIEGPGAQPATAWPVDQP